jgi:ATP-binding cassette subfamily F protein uup
MAHLLGAEKLHLEFPTRVIFEGVTVGINDGDRIGIVGRNGDGKSTLMKILAGRLEPDSGRVTRSGGLTLGMLDQSDDVDPTLTVGEAIVGGIEEYIWAGDPKVRDVLTGLVTDVPWDALVGDLSGGQRRRVALAALLVGDWDVIFLDEPTNHLDVEGISWLAGHLNKRWPSGQGGLVVVTHDRWFLDEISTSTWEVHDRILEPFEGGYAAYVLQRVERDRSAAVSEAKRQNLMKKELAWLRRGAPARTAKPKFRIEAANELIANEPPVRDSISLSSMAMQRLGKDVVDLEDVSVSYGDKHVLRDITWRIAPGERTGILGINGAGKSTLLGLVSGHVKATSGRVKRGTTVKIATLTQQLDELKDVQNDRVSAVVATKRTTYMAGGKEMTPGQLLERLGFASAQLSTPVKDLSGGQKRRLQLLLILLDEPNVLILDEPTNDLDTDMLVAMEDLLDTWPGTLLVISHDRYLLERVTDNQYAVMDGHFTHLPNGVDQYLALRSKQMAAPSVSVAAAATAQGNSASAEGSPGSSASASASAPASAPVAAKPVPKVSGAELRNAEKEFGSIERKIAKQQADVAAVHERMATHDQSDFAGLGELSAEISRIEGVIADLEMRWLVLSDLLGH